MCRRRSVLLLGLIAFASAWLTAQEREVRSQQHPAGDGDGNIAAFESKTGRNLWHYYLGVPVRSTGGTTYMVDGKQYFLVPSGGMLTAFALP